MGKKSSKSPDVSGAAKIEGEFAREAGRDQIYADRADQTNPFGNLTWGTEEYIDPASGEKVTKWNQNQTFNPQTQKIIDNQMGMMGGRGDLANSMMDRINNEMGAAPDWAQFGQAQGLQYDPTELRNRAESDFYQKQTNRLDPQFAQQREQLDLRLRNQGLTAGDSAYDAQMSTFGNKQNDAYEQARLGATQAGMGEANQLWNQQVQGNQMANTLRDQQIQEYLSKRGYSLGEQSSLSDSDEIGDLIAVAGE